VTPAPAVDVAVAADFLRAHYGFDVDEVVAVPRPGLWTTAFFFRQAGRQLVVRFADTAWNFEKDRRFAGYGSDDLPIPRVLEIGDAFDGLHYAVSTRAHGTFLEDLDHDAMTCALPSVFRTLDALRAVDVSGSAGYGSHLPNFDGERPTWREFLLAVDDDQPALAANPVRGWRVMLDSRPDAARTFADAYSALASSVDGCPDARHLVHNDLLHGNVLVAHDRVTAVFDWQCAMYGDFLYDAAALSFWAPWFPALRHADAGRAVRHHYEEIGLTVPGLELRLRCYEVHIGLCHLGYHAYMQDWDELDRVARRTREVLTGESAS
jgi:hygromycin-B 4-O-kinase